MTAPITVADFEAYYDRDFIFGTAKNTVRTADIQRAIDRANMVFNASLWNSATDSATAFQLVTAHFLVKALESCGGLNKRGAGSRSTGSGPIASKSAGSLNVSYSLPAELTDNPVLNDFLTTGYGKMYLQLVVPMLIGGMGIAAGGTQP